LFKANDSYYVRYPNAQAEFRCHDESLLLASACPSAPSRAGLHLFDMFVISTQSVVRVSPARSSACGCSVFC
jgi:hypothetical protein